MNGSRFEGFRNPSSRKDGGLGQALQRSHSRSTLDITSPLKKRQLGDGQIGGQGYFYYCALCDEALILSAKLVEPRKIILLVERCPGCGFELERVMKCEALRVPPGVGFEVSPKCNIPEGLFEPAPISQPTFRRSSSLNRDFRPSITTGIGQVDQVLFLRFGQLAALEGRASHDLSLLLCVRASLPEPLGMDSDVIFLDGGNLFDAYKISHYSIGQGLGVEKAQKRVHLSRAFTYHQLDSLITEKLPQAIDEYDARLAIVSDITQLYCDPDVRDKQEALDIFKRGVRFLNSLSQQRNILIVTTNLQQRNKRMENALISLAHVFARLDNMGAFVQLTVHRQGFESQEELLALDDQTPLRIWQKR